MELGAPNAEEQLAPRKPDNPYQVHGRPLGDFVNSMQKLRAGQPSQHDVSRFGKEEIAADVLH